MDRIRWINHAGFELQTVGLRIVCDPWLTGLAFDQSWALLSETKFKPEDFDGVDYIWFSHEHPDHFSPADLRNIPKAIRSTITILFQKSKDGRVAAFCRTLGFKQVNEIEDWERTALGRGVYITIKKTDDGGDSLCLIETPTRKYLNVNDCVAADTRAFHQKIFNRLGRPDVLLVQFSFANWAGNPGDFEPMKRAATQKLEDIDTQLSIYCPKILIPFASFVWFCRHENFHLNAGANRIRNVFERFQAKTGCVVLYPGEMYEVGLPRDSASAIRRYEADQARHREPLDVKDETFTVEQLEELSVHHQKTIAKENSLWLFRPAQWLGLLRPVNIHQTDIGKSLAYSMFGGIRWTSTARTAAEIEFSSAAMARMLRYGTGYDTLYISGRFTEYRSGSRFALSRHFMVLRRNENGQFFPSTFFSLGFLKTRLGVQEAFAVPVPADSCQTPAM